MPRLAPVSSRVRRGWLLVAMAVIVNSWIEPRLGPRRRQVGPRERDAVVQPVQPFLPELDLDRHYPIARPERRPRHRADGEFRGIQCNRLLESEAAFQRA